MIKQFAKRLAKRKAQTVASGLFIKFILPLLIISGVFFGILFAVLSIAGNAVNKSSGGIDVVGEGMLSEEVVNHLPLIEMYASEYDIEDYVGVIMALMMQESGGKGNDPMQASESKCGKVDCITDPEESIQQGVMYFSQVLEQAENDVELALQSYNFGSGFIDFVMDNGGSYTLDLAIEFSQMKYEELKGTGDYGCIRPEAIQYNACYGDIFYVDAVMKYYPGDMVTPIDGNYIFPVFNVQVTSNYGWRTHPITGIRKLHKGIDFGCVNHVTPIFSSSSGVVDYAGFHKNKDGSPGYGNLVMIRHADGIITAYAHLDSIKVSEGQKVLQGQAIGVCGNTGSSTGPHLHFETKTNLWDGHMDPKMIINDFGG